MRTRLLIALLTTALLAACGGGGERPGGAERSAAADDSPNPAPPRAEPGDDATELPFEEPARDVTAWDRVTAGIEPDGTVPKEVALEAFALAIGPIPGVEVPDGEPGVESGSTALRWLSRYADELTPAQRSAVDDALRPTNAAVEIPRRLRGGGLGKAARTTGLGEDEYSCTIENSGVFEDDEHGKQLRHLVDGEREKLEAAFGFPLGIRVHVTVGRSKEGSSALAWASPQAPDCTAGPATSCRIHLLVDQLVQHNEQTTHATVAHELVHFFQATWLPVRNALTRPDWITEGFADFAGHELNPGGNRSNLRWYIGHPSDQLFTRDYDAQGFFFHLFRAGADVYGRYRNAFKLRASEDEFAHLTAGVGTEFTDTWASALTLELDRGDAWDTPDAPADAEAQFARLGIRNGVYILVNAGPATTRLGHLDFAADVVRFEFSGEGHGRVSWDGGADVELRRLGGKSYCNRPGGCECPEGSTGSPPRAQLPSDGAQVSAAGMADGTYAKVTGIALDEYCEKPSIDPCVVGSWTSSEWVLPGPAPELTARGGDGAQVRISQDGEAAWDFGPMDPLEMHDPDIDLATFMHTSGSATAQIGTDDGSWIVHEADFTAMEGSTQTNIAGEYPAEGVGTFVLGLDGAYTCRDDLLSYTTQHPVSGGTVSILLQRD